MCVRQNQAPGRPRCPGTHGAATHRGVAGVGSEYLDILPASERLGGFLLKLIRNNVISQSVITYLALRKKESRS